MTVREEVRERIQRDPQLVKLRQKIERGKASYTDTAAYSVRAGKLLGEIFSRRLPEIPPEEREQLCVDLLHDQYVDINAAVDTAQRFMDDAQGLHLAPQHAPFDSVRGHQIGSALRDLSKSAAVLQRRAKAAPETAVKAMHDDRMKTEAKFRHGAGLDCRITRVAVNGCCAWCTKMAGRFAYGEEPDDIYRRHDNCDCTVTFENGRKRQDVWSKREWEAPEEDAGAPEPTRLTAEQAEEREAQHPVIAFSPEQAAGLQAEHQLSYLTRGRSSGTMNTGKGSEPASNHWYEQIGTIDPSDKRAAAELLRDFERQYSDSQIEHCRVITASGEVYDVHGDRWTVNTTLLGERMRGSTNEHNHVTGESQYSFSWEDLRDSAEDGSKFAIAFDEKYRYTMIFPDAPLNPDAVYEAYHDADEEVGSINAESYFFGNGKQISDEDYQHEVICRACERLGVHYERKRKS